MFRESERVSGLFLSGVSSRFDKLFGVKVEQEVSTV